MGEDFLRCQGNIQFKSHRSFIPFSLQTVTLLLIVKALGLIGDTPHHECSIEHFATYTRF
ncbi:hypothetical protein [Microcoleus sp.]|uniref:hypothetical protein n=1 Tax=Microcoleus sp. TaxID=44472 RepID=UPI003592EA49